MKKILCIICCTLFIYACATSSDDGSDSNTGENISQGGDVSGGGNTPSQDENTPPAPVEPFVALSFQRSAFCDVGYSSDTSDNWNNGELNSGETAYFLIAVKNTGHATSPRVYNVSLGLFDPYVKLTEPEYRFSNNVVVAGTAVDSIGNKNDSPLFLVNQSNGTCNYLPYSYKLTIAENTPPNYKTNIIVNAEYYYGGYKYSIDILPIVINPSVEENPNVPTNITPIDTKYWGRWIYLENPEKEAFLGKNTRSDACTAYDDDLLECKFTTYIQPSESSSTNITPTVTKKYLVRAGSSYLKVRGSVKELATSSAKYSGNLKVGGAGFGSLNAALSISRTDKNGSKTEYGKTETKEDGTFEFSNVPSGNYVVNIEDSTLSGSANVSINNSDADIGVITAVPKNNINFKSELIFDESKNNTSKFLFANNTVYTGKIRITNTGKTEAAAMTYDFKIDDPAVYQFTDETASNVGTLQAGKYKDIKFTVAFNPIDLPKKTIKMSITAKDGYKQEWHDYVSFDIFSRYSLFKAKAEKSLNGFLNIPGQKILTVQGTDITEKIPYIPGETYTLTLVNADIKNETKYSFALDGEPSDYSLFKDTSAHEPNDTDETATIVRRGEAIVSYLSKSGFGKRERQEGDIDRFKIIMQ